MGGALTPDADAERARRLHERTGEIELLISGALVFGLLQLPPVIDEVVASLTPGLGRGGFIAVFMISFYVRLIVATLTAAFLLHLVTRAYWVGLIGLDSVFPDGIHWERIKYGPIARATYARRVPRLSVMARRADDFGSSIFSFAFWISVLFVWSIVFGLVLGGLWYGLRATVLPGLGGVWFFVAAMTFALVPTVAIAIDKALAGRLDPESRLGRGLERTIAGAYWISAGPIFMPIQFTLFSRVRKAFIWPLFVGVFAVLMFGYFAADVWTTDAMRISGTDLFPSRPGPRAVVDDYFASSRARDARVPYVQAPVVEDAYLHVTVPLTALRLTERFPVACPDFERAGRTGFVEGPDFTEPADAAYERRLLGCLGRVWTLRLDGEERPVDWDLLWSGRTGPTSLVAYLPVAGLAPGAHLLEVREVAARLDEEERAALDASGEEPPGPAVHYIRFRR